MDFDRMLLLTFAGSGVAYGVMEHFQLFNTPMSKYRSEWLQQKAGLIDAHIAFVGLYAAAPASFFCGCVFFGRPMLLGAALYVGHFIKRMWECAFVHIYSGSMDVATTVYLASCYVVIGQVFAYSLASDGHPVGGDRSTLFWLVVWCTGEGINARHHWLLRSLRSSKEEGHREKYSIPDHGLFSVALFPHYFGEMVAWTALAMLVNHDAIHGINLFMFFLQLGRSSAGRQWYINKFGAAAVSKKYNVIPGLF